MVSELFISCGFSRRRDTCCISVTCSSCCTPSEQWTVSPLGKSEPVERCNWYGTTPALSTILSLRIVKLCLFVKTKTVSCYSKAGEFFQSAHSLYPSLPFFLFFSPSSSNTSLSPTLLHPFDSSKDSSANNIDVGLSSPRWQRSVRPPC